MALDLSAPLTYVNDDGATRPRLRPRHRAPPPCPFQQVDASGLGRVITSLPLASRPRPAAPVGPQPPRRRRRHHLAGADQHHQRLPGLSIGGDVELTVPAGKHLQTLALTDDRRHPDPGVRRAGAPAGRAHRGVDRRRLPQTLGGSVSASLDVSVDDAPTPSRTGENSTEPHARPARSTDLADGIDAGDVTVTADDADRADLLKALNFDAEQPDLALRRRARRPSRAPAATSPR